MKTTLITIAIAASQLYLYAGSTERPADYVAHEWGTFTSVQGADGQLIQWNPLDSSELPAFVYDRSKPSGHPRLRYADGKSAYTSLQRMETPVIYFYSDQERELDVTVRFPKGLVTEWYPYAEGIGPSFVDPLPLFTMLDHAVRQTGLDPDFSFSVFDPKEGIRDSLIRWPKVRIVPTGELTETHCRIPVEASGSHYYAARATDANLIRVQANPSGPDKAQQYEKFLFYRGLGTFETPLTVSFSAADGAHLTLHNRGPGDLTRLFVLDVQGGQASLVSSERLLAGQQRSVRLADRDTFQPLARVIDRLDGQMRQALEGEGLYPREAAAMVETWRDSWFEEHGLRVLYLLPRSWTDEVLPMNIVPAPKELVRVMVGRAEVIVPQVEAEVRQQIVQFNSSDVIAKAEAIARFRGMSLGRFAEPAIRLALNDEDSRDLKDAGWELFAASRKPGKSLAQKF